MSHKIFDNDLVVIRKNKVTLTLNKPAYIGIYIFELSKVLMYKFHYDYIKNKYGYKSRLLFTDTDSLMYEIMTEDVYADFRNSKDMFDFSKYSTKSKYYDNSKKLVFGKTKDETAGLPIEKFVRLKTKMYSYLVDDNSEQEKAKGSSEHSMNRIQSKDHRTGTCEVNKTSLSYFDDKICIQSNERDGSNLCY